MTNKLSFVLNRSPQAAISKRFEDSEKAQNSFELRLEVRRLSEVVKYTNSRLLGG